jgi:hypothetical protein
LPTDVIFGALQNDVVRKNMLLVSNNNHPTVKGLIRHDILMMRLPMTTTIL